MQNFSEKNLNILIPSLIPEIDLAKKAILPQRYYLFQVCTLLLTNDGQVDEGVPRLRRPEVDPAPVEPLLGPPDPGDLQAGGGVGRVRTGVEPGPTAEAAAGGGLAPAGGSRVAGGGAGVVTVKRRGNEFANVCEKGLCSCWLAHILMSKGHL